MDSEPIERPEQVGKKGGKASACRSFGAAIISLNLLSCLSAPAETAAYRMPLIKQQSNLSQLTSTRSNKVDYIVGNQIRESQDHVWEAVRIGASTYVSKADGSAIARRLRAIDELISENRLVEAKKIIQLSIEDRSSGWSEGKIEQALLLFYKGAVSYLLGDLLDAELASQEALKKLTRLETSNPELELLVLNQIAAYYLAAKKYDRAHEILVRAQHVVTALGSDNNPLVGITFLNLGNHAIAARRTAEARRSLRRAIRILSGKGSHNRQLLTALNSLYLLEVMEGKLADAESLLSLIQTQIPYQIGKADSELSVLYYNAAAFTIIYARTMTLYFLLLALA